MNKSEVRSSLKIYFSSFCCVYCIEQKRQQGNVLLHFLSLWLGTCNVNMPKYGRTQAVDKSLSLFFFFFFSVFCVHFDCRSRLSCTEALAHPWMVSFTPLTRRPTKSLRKEKMRRFLAKRKWKVKHFWKITGQMYNFLIGAFRRRPFKAIVLHMPEALVRMWLLILHCVSF